MRNLIVGVALAAALCASPVIAKEKAMKEGAQPSSAVQENQNRLQNKDGTFQGKPVVQGPAHWTNGPDTASSGSSSGESGASGGSLQK